MFWMGEAPTVPGIRARFSRPPRPWARLYSTRPCQDWPAPARSSTRSGTLAVFEHLLAADRHVQHHAVDVARQDDIAAAAQHEARQAGQAGIGQGGAQHLDAGDPHVKAGAGGDAEGVAVLQGKIGKNGEVGVHGGKIKFVPIIPAGRGARDAGRCPLKYRHSSFPNKRTSMPSFDVVCEADMVEVKNAVEQSNKEITTRFDFKGSSAKVEQKEHEITAYADAEFQLDQVRDVLTNKLAKRKVDVRFLDEGKIEKIGGDKVKQVIKVKNGIETDDAKKIVRVIKDSKMKVQASIQGDAVRVTGAKRDDLQAAMAMLRKDVADLPLEFNNFRD